MKRFPHALTLGMVLLSLAAERTERVARSDSPTIPPESAIADWIQQLDADTYQMREDATAALIGVGKDAVPHVLAIADSRNPEVRNRAFLILAKVTQSDQAGDCRAAVDALETLLKSQRRATVVRAEGALAWHHQQARDREQIAVSALSQMHADFCGDAYGRVRSCNLSLFQIPPGGLKPLKSLAKLESLDLSGTQIADAELVHVGKLSHLRKLQLVHTPVGDQGLAHLAGLNNLESLNLVATNITDKGLIHLAGLTQLKTLRLHATAVTDEGVRQLRQSLPDAEIHR